MTHTSRSFGLLSLLAIGLPFAAIGCMEDDGDPVEDLEIEDGKQDAFNAADHGWLVFDHGARGTVTSTQRLHAYRFQLTGSADVSFTTSASGSDIDTVLYLYRRNPTTHLWGPSIARNDDEAPGRTWSTIDRHLSAGEYRVVLKGKPPADGAFALEAGCSGAGCPDDEAQCRFDNLVPPPAVTALNQACLNTITKVLDASSAVRRDVRSSLATSNALAAHERRGFELAARGQCTTDRFEELDLSSATTADGTSAIRVKVDTDVGYDTYFVMNEQARPLLTLKWLHDSAAFSWSCPASSTPALDDPDEYCLASYLRVTVPEHTSLLSGSGTGPAAAVATGVSPLVRAALRAHEQGGSSYAVTSYEFTTWTVEQERAARVTVHSQAGTATYTLSGGDHPYLISRTSNGHAKMVCKDGV